MQPKVWYGADDSRRLWTFNHKNNLQNAVFLDFAEKSTKISLSALFPLMDNFLGEMWGIRYN